VPRLRGEIVVVKISEKDLAGLVPASSPIQPVPPIFTTIQSIIKGVNEMLGSYKELTGKNTPHKTMNQSENPPPSFSEARAIKRLENTPIRKEQTTVMGTEFGELLKGLIKSCHTLEGLGYGGKTIGEALTELPITITQAKEFLLNIEEKRKRNNVET